MKRKSLMMALLIAVLAGCGGNGSSTVLPETTSSESSCTTDAYEVGYCEETGIIGFSVATTGPSGTFTINDSIQLKFYYGRSIEEFFTKEYDEYVGATFYLQPYFRIDNFDIRGEDVICYDRYEYLDMIELPKMMDDVCLFEKKNPILTQYVTLDINFSQYYQVFMDAEAYDNDIEHYDTVEDYLENPRPVEAQIESTCIRLLFDLYSEKDDEDVKAHNINGYSQFKCEMIDDQVKIDYWVRNPSATKENNNQVAIG